MREMIYEIEDRNKFLISVTGKSNINNNNNNTTSGKVFYLPFSNPKIGSGGNGRFVDLILNEEIKG